MRPPENAHPPEVETLCSLDSRPCAKLRWSSSAMSAARLCAERAGKASEGDCLCVSRRLTPGLDSPQELAAICFLALGLATRVWISLGHAWLGLIKLGREAD